MGIGAIIWTTIRFVSFLCVVAGSFVRIAELFSWPRFTPATFEVRGPSFSVSHQRSVLRRLMPHASIRFTPSRSISFTTAVVSANSLAPNFSLLRSEYGFDL